MSSDLNSHVIRDLVIANRILAREGVIDDFGHVSVRNPANPNRYFIARSRSPEIVSADDIVEFTLEGEPVQAENRRLYIERALHGAIYMARPDVNSVVHHHARSILPFTITELPLKPVFHMAAVIGAEVPKWDSQDEFGDTNMLIDDLPKGHSVARALGDGSTVVLRGHGAVCVAPGLAAACFLSVYMMENARVLLETLPHGNPVYLTSGEVEQTAKLLLSDVPMNRAWDYYKARAGFPGI